MFKTHSEEIIWGNRTLKIETGKVARQADGSVIVTYGETTVLATVCAEQKPKPGLDFFPLTVNYQEKAYAAGRIPGGYFKREGRPTEKETLVSRLIDRPIRPLFVKEFKNETQVIATVLSHDTENDPDIISIIACSAALTISGIPFKGPVGAARIGYINNEYVLNPKTEELLDSSLDLVVAGTKNAVLMIESEAKELSEDIMLGGVMFAHSNMQPVIDMIIKLAQKSAKDMREIEISDHSELDAKIEKIIKTDVTKAYKIADKKERQSTLSGIKDKVIAELNPNEEINYDQNDILSCFKTVEKSIVRQSILKTSKRIDGRGLEDIRPIVSEIAVLPRTHGSALFTRGETQAIAVATLGTGQDEQYVDSLNGTYKQSFMLHYNFPPYSVGEVGRTGFTSRREVGHGKLAWRAIHPVLPNKEDFPYTIRVVSEITESNGSSSMATVCGTSLALMDAGVPIKSPVAGIAMGLILEGKDFAVLSDILGDEDHLGDMDFKVAGTSEGVTTLQMDIKISGITEDIMKIALAQAKKGRTHILGEMAKVITESRNDVGEFAPRIVTVNIPVDKIRDIIGAGGKIIKQMVEESGAQISVEDNGVVTVASANKASIELALEKIHMIVAEPEVGEIYEGNVVKVVDFGAFVNFFGPKDGLVHISQLNDGRPETVSEVVNEGDKVFVKLMGFDDRGKVRLTMKHIDQETGKQVEGTNNNADEEPPKRKRPARPSSRERNK
ncbi:MAG: polyribonucleotide nucleotidyltransferase [Alphaproteobacteria bacterium]|jgi:polyribonucleotide nucleotidyltransferase|tara:strand:+ start:41602 stop:43785 length:2184 start_codon:yes stop_codon:yes gene_type:complete